jgi:hypothetical protein
LSDQHVCDYRGIPDSLGPQEILQPRLLRVEGLDHSSGGFQLGVEILAIDPLQLRKFVEAVLFELIRVHVPRNVFSAVNGLVATPQQ